MLKVGCNIIYGVSIISSVFFLKRYIGKNWNYGHCPLCPFLYKGIVKFMGIMPIVHKVH